MDTLASIVVSENHRGSVTSVSYARGVSDRFATASVDGTVRVWDIADYGVLTTAVVRDAGEPLCLVLTQVRAQGRRTGPSSVPRLKLQGRIALVCATFESVLDFLQRNNWTLQRDRPSTVCSNRIGETHWFARTVISGLAWVEHITRL